MSCKAFLSVLLLSFVFLHCQVSAEINSYDFRYIFLNASIGTPEQKVPFIVDTSGFYSVLRVYPVDKGGAYNQNVSSTFDKGGPAHGPFNETLGYKATESFKINGVAVQKGPFVVYNGGPHPTFPEFAGHMGLSRPAAGEDPSFVQYVLEGMDDKVLTIAFEGDVDYDENTHGAVALGNRMPDRCANDWILTPESTKSRAQWSLDLDNFSFGENSFAAPGYVSFNLEMRMFQFPQRYYGDLQTALKADWLWNIPCNTTIELVFTIAGREIRIQPEDYVQRGVVQGQKVCRPAFLFNNYDEHAFSFSYTFLHKRCVLLDYAHNQVGFATRLSTV